MCFWTFKVGNLANWAAATNSGFDSNNAKKPPQTGCLTITFRISVLLIESPRSFTISKTQRFDDRIVGAHMAQNIYGH